MVYFAGLDVSKQLTSICVVNGDGIVMGEGVVPTEPKAVVAFLRGKRRRYRRVGLEAGGLPRWLRDELVKGRLPAVLIETRHAHRVLSTRQNKTDRNDARGIAELMRTGSFHEVHSKSLESRQIKSLLTVRRLLVQKRVDVEGTIRGVLLQSGYKLGSRKAGTYESRVRHLVRHDGFDAFTIESLLVARKAILDQAALLSARAIEIARADPICRRLMTAPSVGPMTALEYRAAIDDPARFRRSRTVAAHLGLTPTLQQSGETSRKGRISRWGDAAVRACLFMAARTILSRMSRPSAIQSWGRAIAAKRGKNKAAVAVARRLAVTLHSMWKNGTDFRWDADSVEGPV